MLTALLTISTAQAGAYVAAQAGVEAPIEAGTRSDTGPVYGLLAGWRLDAGPLVVQPELSGRMSRASESITVSGGAAAFLGDHLLLGAYAHVGLPVAGGYPVPTLEGGIALDVAVVPLVALGARAGYTYLDTVHLKCGTCAQPAHQFASAVVTAGVRF